MCFYYHLLIIYIFLLHELNSFPIFSDQIHSLQLFIAFALFPSLNCCLHLFVLFLKIISHQLPESRLHLYL